MTPIMRTGTCPHCGEPVIMEPTSGSGGALRMFDPDRSTAGRWLFDSYAGTMIRGDAAAVPVGHLPHQAVCESWPVDDMATVYAFAARG